jgi:hypothetical protein
MIAWLFSVEALGAFLVCFATLMIFSFLYRDNPFYKFAEHVFVGVSTGYGIVLVWFQILRPNLLDRLAPPADAVRLQLLRAGELAPEEFATRAVSLGERLAHGQFVYYVFLALGILMLFKISRKLHWLSRWPLAYVIGAFAGIQIIQAAQGALIPQLEATMKDFSGKEAVVAGLEESGTPPEGELAARRAAMGAAVEEHLVALTDPASAKRAADLWQKELEARLLDLAGATDLDAPGAGPREAFKTMRVRQAELVEREREFEALLCAELGGRPLEEALQRAARGLAADSPLPRMNQALREEEWSRDPLRPEDLAALELAPWQERQALLATRVWLESPAGVDRLTEALAGYTGLPPQVAREALAYPDGRPPLVQVLRSEAFPAGAQPDWSLPITRRLADSLLSDVNPRPDRLGDYKATQTADLSTRVGNATLRGELEARLALFDQAPDSLRGRAQLAFLELWRQGLAAELGYLRQGWLLQAIGAYSAPDWSLPHSRAQLAAYRENPATKGLGTAMLVEILSNLIVVVGVCAGVFYFFFSKKHTGALGAVSKVGIAFLMMSFGASFGYTVMGRISLAIGRFQDLLAWPWMAGTALLVLIGALYLESRRKPA